MRFTPDKHLHSKEHVLADDLSTMLSEPKRFAAYLGIAKRYYESDLRALARRVLEKSDLPVEARGKYFFAALKGLAKRPGVKFTPLERRRFLPAVETQISDGSTTLPPAGRKRSVLTGFKRKQKNKKKNAGKTSNRNKSPHLPSRY